MTGEYRNPPPWVMTICAGCGAVLGGAISDSLTASLVLAGVAVLVFLGAWLLVRRRDRSRGA